MRSASVERSPRPQRVLAVLEDGCEHSNADLVREAKVRTVNSRFLLNVANLGTCAIHPFLADADS